MANKHQVSAERVIAAPPDTIFDVLTDPSMHPVIDGSSSVRGASERNPDRLERGSKFTMSMRIGVPYFIRNVVVEYEENRLIAWRHVGRHRWRWELEPVDGGTRVIHTFDWSKAISKTYITMFNWPERNLEGMRATLERLEEQVTGS